MDSGADTVQKIVITGAIILALFIVLVIGYSLYTKAKVAEGELATKEALDSQTKKETQSAAVSLTGEAKNSSAFSYDGLVQKKQDQATTTDFSVVNEQTPVDVPQEEPTPTEESVPPEDNTPVVATKPVQKNYVDNDRPLTQEEIIRIRQLPIDNSPSGNLQTSLEEESNGQYKARY
jgi:hypothetical protein